MKETIARLWRSRALVSNLARRELRARYRGSVLGFLWSILNPLLLLAIYSVVFTAVFTPRADVRPYPLFLFGGVLAWSFLSSSILDAAETFKTNGPLLRKAVVSPEVFPGVAVLAQAFHFLWALPVLAAATLYFRFAGAVRVGWAALQLAPVMLLLGAAVLGASLFVSAVSVHFQDVRNLLQNVLTFWFFATPVIYSVDGVPGRFRFWLRLNPAAAYFEGIHESIFAGRPISGRDWAAMAVVSVVAISIGGAVFSRLRDSIAEEA
ncbi:MAG: ABC transporter permease [Thermoanaerobaculia bacterium]